jgi:hypothetical protein
MSTPPAQVRPNLKRIVASLMAIGALTAMVRSERLDGVGDEAALEGRFVLTRSALPDVGGPGLVTRTIRPTHPDIGHISAFMSTIGASAALNDLDRNGRPDDICYVDTTTSRALVAPAPGTGDRYSGFALDPTLGGAVPPIRDYSYPSTCLPADFDEDGDVDLLITYAGRTPVLYTARSEAGPGSPLSAAQFVPSDMIPGGHVWTTTAATVADLDGDGHSELILSNYFADDMAIYDPAGSGPSVWMPDTFSRAYNGGGIRIFSVVRPTPAGQPASFVENRDGLPPILRTGWGLALGAHDLDGDLMPELYVANDFGPDRLLWNRSTRGQLRFEMLEGESHFTVPQSKVLGHDSFKGMGIDFGDLNNDDIPDLYVSNITAAMALQESQLLFLSTGARDAMAKGIAPYRDGGEALGLARSGWAWDAKLEDFDNDGTLEAIQAVGFMKGTTSRWPEIQELAVGNDRLVAKARRAWPNLQAGDDVSGRDTNPFFVRVGDRYVDIAARIGFREDQVSRGIALGDVDGDGRVDMVVANMWAPASFYRNAGTRTGAFLGLHLKLPVGPVASAATVIRDGHTVWDTPTRAPIGASATIWLPDGRKVTRQVDGGNGHTGKRSPDLLFGLGAASGPIRVELKWRTATGTLRSETHTLTPGWHSVLLSGSEVSGS